MLDPALDPLGQFALRLQRLLRRLHGRIQLREILDDVVDDRLLLRQGLQVDPHVLQDVHDDVRLALRLVDVAAPRLDDPHPLLGLGHARQDLIHPLLELDDVLTVIGDVL